MIIYGFTSYEYGDEYSGFGCATTCLACHRNSVSIEGDIIGDEYVWYTSGHNTRCPLGAAFEELVEKLKEL